MGDVDFDKLNLFLKSLSLVVNDADSNRQISKNDTVHGQGLDVFVSGGSSFDPHKAYSFKDSELEYLYELVRAFVPLSTSLWKDAYALDQGKRELQVLNLLREKMESREKEEKDNVGRRKRIQTTMVYWKAVKKMNLTQEQLNREIDLFKVMIAKHKPLNSREHQEIATNAELTIGILKEVMPSRAKR